MYVCVCIHVKVYNMKVAKKINYWSVRVLFCPCVCVYSNTKTIIIIYIVLLLNLNTLYQLTNNYLRFIRNLKNC